MIQTDLYSFSYKKGSLVPVCKRCGAEHFYRDGKNVHDIQRYKCRVCGFRFLWTSDLPRRHFFSSIMSFAIECYTSLRMAASLRGIAQILKKAFNVTVSHEGIRQWIMNAKHSIDGNYTPCLTWHLDETYVKIKGEGHWLWIARGRETGQVLAWHLTKTRLLDDAKRIVGKALENNQGIRPECIITDGLWQYPIAIYKVMRWSWREQHEKHIIDSGIGKNWFIERLNREIKRRLRWFSTFQALASAKAFFGLWFYHHNTRYFT